MAAPQTFDSCMGKWRRDDNKDDIMSGCGIRSADNIFGRILEKITDLKTRTG